VSDAAPVHLMAPDHKFLSIKVWRIQKKLHKKEIVLRHRATTLSQGIELVELTVMTPIITTTSKAEGAIFFFFRQEGKDDKSCTTQMTNEHKPIDQATDNYDSMH
jgi:hypothetical protein